MDGLDAVIANRLRAALDEQGMRREDFAWQMSTLGFKWTGNRVTQVLTGRRLISLLELAAACSILRRSLADLLADDEDLIELPSDAVVSVADIAAALGDGAPTWARKAQHSKLLGRVLGDPTEVAYKASRRLAVSVEEVDAGAHALWGRGLAEERDRRVEAAEGESGRAVQARRGHVTRALLEELRVHFQSARSA